MWYVKLRAPDSNCTEKSSMQFWQSIAPFAGTRPSITPETISSFGPSKDNTTKPDDQSPTASQQDAVIPSSAKKLTSKMNQSDKVLTYLKASVSTYICMLQVVSICHDRLLGG